MWKEILIYSAAGMLAFVLFAIWFVIRKLLIRVYQPKIFISYRRTDQKSTGVPERLYEDLCGRYGPDNVFKDTHDIQAGERYPDVLSGWLAISDVIVAVIGENWAGENEANRPRILNVIQNSGDKNDWVRHEVEVASNKNRLLVVLAHRFFLALGYTHRALHRPLSS